MIFVLLGRGNALCLARLGRAKSTEISRFKAGSDLSLYPRGTVYGTAIQRIYFGIIQGGFSP